VENVHSHESWRKAKLAGQKPPLKLKEIWAIGIHFHLAKRIQDLALFSLVIDCKLRDCALANLRVRDVANGTQIAPRAIVMQLKAQRPVQFELREPIRESIAARICRAVLTPEHFLLTVDARRLHQSGGSV
jgi:hypothetical protein